MCEREESGRGGGGLGMRSKARGEIGDRWMLDRDADGRNRNDFPSLSLSRALFSGDLFLSSLVITNPDPNSDSISNS